MSTPISDSLRWRSGAVRDAARALEAGATNAQAAWEVRARNAALSPAQLRYAAHNARRRLVAAGWVPPAAPPTARPRGPHGQFLPRIDPPTPPTAAEAPPAADAETPRETFDAGVVRQLTEALADVVARGWAKLPAQLKADIATALAIGSPDDLAKALTAPLADPVKGALEVLDVLVGPLAAAVQAWQPYRFSFDVDRARIQYSGELIARPPRPAPSPASEA